VDGQHERPYAAVFPARRDAFIRVRSFIEETCARAAVRRADCLRLTLLIEELFTNTVVHGHGRDCDAPVRLVLTLTPPAIGVEYEDTARPHNQFLSVYEPGDADDLEHRRVGGLGITLITAMAEDVGYASHEGRNQIRFRLPLVD
jgi:anti-sigma regulatory factor (Ser/Thr protein kinase)